MDILGQSSLLVGVTSFALGFSVLARNVRNKLFLAFAILTTLISLWGLAFFLNRIWGEPFYRLHLLFNVWLAPASLAFILFMVRIHDRISRFFLNLSLVAALALSVALIFRFDYIRWILDLIYFVPAMVVVQILRLMWIDRRLAAGHRRTPKLPTVGLSRRNLIYIGGLIVLSTCVMDHIPWMGRSVPALGNLALLGYLFFISQAISQQRLLNFGALFSRFLVLTAVALTLTAVYSVLVGWIQNSPELFFLNSFIASFLILMLLEPIRSAVGYFTQRLLSQKHRRLEHTLREAQRSLAGVVDPIGLFHAVLHLLEQTLQPEWAAFFVLRADGTKYRRAKAVGTSKEEGTALREILANHPLMEYCSRLRRRGELPVLLDQIIENEIDRSASRVQRERFTALLEGLRALGCNLLIPLFDEGDQILGFTVLRVHAPPEPWGGNWGLLRILYPYFEQAAKTLRSMEIFVRQREKERLAALGEMAAGLAHEIRNPLGAIKGAAQFLDPTEDRPESRFLRVIIEEVDRLNRVVTQFLDYSKPAVIESKPVDLAALAKKTVDLLQAGLSPDASLEFVSPRQRILVPGSAEQIQQVLLNLIQNSLRALDQKPGGKIRVSIEQQGGDSKRPEVILGVEDNGRGIKKEHIDKLFIPFFTTSPQGTGLGLPISQKIIEAHRGRIEVASEEGRFSRFSVILPVILPGVSSEAPGGGTGEFQE